MAVKKLMFQVLELMPLSVYQKRIRVSVSELVTAAAAQVVTQMTVLSRSALQINVFQIAFVSPNVIPMTAPAVVNHRIPDQSNSNEAKE